MSLSLSYEFDRRVLIDSSKHVVESPKLMQRALKRREPRLRQLALKIVKVSPPVRSYPADYPLRWKSEKQRKFVMAKYREQGITHYERTGELEDAWQAKFRFSDDGGGFVVENLSPVAQYVVGVNQQPFHYDSGWIRGDEVIDDQIVPLVLDDYEIAFNTIADPFIREGR